MKIKRDMVVLDSAGRKAVVVFIPRNSHTSCLVVYEDQSARWLHAASLSEYCPPREFEIGRDRNGKLLIFGNQFVLKKGERIKVVEVKK